MYKTIIILETFHKNLKVLLITFFRFHLNTKSYIMEAATMILVIGAKVPLSMVGLVAMTQIVPGLMNG